MTRTDRIEHNVTHDARRRFAIRAILLTALILAALITIGFALGMHPID